MVVLLLKELKLISDVIIENNAKLVKAINKNKQKTYNLTGTIMSYYLQEHEKQILKVMIEYVQKNIKCKNILTLCFDGFMILNEHYKDSLLNELENEIENIMGFKLRLTTKSMEDDFTEALLAEESNIDICPEEFRVKFNCQYMESLNGYAKKKKYFEIFVCKVMRPSVQFMYVENAKCMVKEKSSYDMC